MTSKLTKKIKNKHETKKLTKGQQKSQFQIFLNTLKYVGNTIFTIGPFAKIKTGLWINLE